MPHSPLLRPGRARADHRAPMIDALEPRCLLGFVTLVDVQDPDDTDVFRFQISGPGTMVLNQATRQVTVQGSTGSTALDITLLTPGGNGRLAWNRISVPGRLEHLSAEAVDLTFGAIPGINITGAAGNLVFGDVLTGSVDLPAGAQTITARILDNSSLIAAAPISGILFSNVVGGSTINVARINDLRVKNATGSPAFFSLSVPDASNGFAAKTITVEGDLVGSGIWTMNGNVQTISIKRVLANIASHLDLGVSGRLGTLKGETLRGDFSVRSFGTISVTGQLLGSYFATDGNIDAVQADSVGATLGTASTFGIKSLRAASNLTATIFGTFLDNLLVTGGANGPGNAQLVVDLDGANGFQVGKSWTIAGSLGGLVNIHGNVTSIVLGGANNLTFNAGLVASTSSVPATSTSEFFPGRGIIGTLRFKAAPGDTVNLSNTILNVRQVVNFRSQARINFGAGLDPVAIRFVAVPTTVNFRLSQTPEQLIVSPGTEYTFLNFSYDRLS